MNNRCILRDGVYRQSFFIPYDGWDPREPSWKIEPLAIMPCQFPPGIKPRADYNQTGAGWVGLEGSRSGQWHLAAAVLERALLDVENFHKEPLYAKQAAEWAESEDLRWPYSFVNCCHYLGLHPESVRAWFRKWTERVAAELAEAQAARHRKHAARIAARREARLAALPPPLPLHRTHVLLSRIEPSMRDTRETVQTTPSAAATAGGTGPFRSTMTIGEKLKYIHKHGERDYLALPW